MTPTRKKLIPFTIFGGLVLIAIIVRLNPPESPERPLFTGPAMVVDVIAVASTDYQIRLQSYGTVQPRTLSTLTAQVGGQIVSVNPNVRGGGFFEKGDVLASIDPRDYEANVRIAGAVLMDAKQTMAEARARSDQAKENWERLGNEGDAPDLVLRVPQLEAARARVISAESTLQKAELELERTQIVAPFAGRILRHYADLGQVVSNNAPLADIYATDSVEIRLPIRNRDLGFINLPETYRYKEAAEPVKGVVIRSQLVGDDQWEASLVRTEGAIDETARQLHVIAQIDDPFSVKHEGHTPPKIGQYVTAELQGKRLANVVVIPNSTIYQGSYVYVVIDDVLQRKEIEIAWQNDVDAIISSGLAAGDQLVTTSLGQVTSGIRVSVGGRDSGSKRQAGQGSTTPGRKGATESGANR